MCEHCLIEHMVLVAVLPLIAMACLALYGIAHDLLRD